MKKTVLTKIIFSALATTIMPIMGMLTQTGRDQQKQPKIHNIEVKLHLWSFMPPETLDTPWNTRFDKVDEIRCDYFGISWTKENGLFPVKFAAFTDPQNNIEKCFLQSLPEIVSQNYGKSHDREHLLFPKALPVNFVQSLQNGPVIIEKTNPAGDEKIRITITADKIPSLPFSRPMKFFIGTALVGIAGLIGWLIAQNNVKILDLARNFSNHYKS